MKTTASHRKKIYMIGCFTFMFLLGLSTFSKKASLASTYKSLFYPMSSSNDVGIFELDECSGIGSRKDQCAFVKASCRGFNALYLNLYYCSNIWKPASIAILMSLLLILFGAISVVSSDFFCPNLQTISSKFQLSESMAGVTVLALGNGSPDLFSTFSAMDSGAGSLAIGELIGAAFFIVAIVSGCMGIIRPFQSQRITFKRDASFLTGAIMIVTWIVYHQRIYWYHSVILISYYICYVSMVVLGAYTSTTDDPIISQKERKKDGVSINVDESTHLLYQAALIQGGNLFRRSVGKLPRTLSIPKTGFSSMHSNLSDFSNQQHLGHIIRPTSPNSSRASVYFDATMPRTTSTNGSISIARSYRRPMTPRIGIRTSVFGAIEFQEQINNLCRINASHQAHEESQYLHPNRRHRQVSMPPPMRRNLQQGPLQSMAHSPQQQKNVYRRYSVGGRKRAVTMTDQLVTPTPSSILSSSYNHLSTHQEAVIHPPTDDYFTYLSDHQIQPRIIQIQSHSTSPQHTNNQLPEVSIPEIRLAPPNENQTTVSEFIDVNSWCSPLNSPALSPRTRGSTTNSLAPPSLISEYDSFVSARQSFELSPSNSFNHPNELHAIFHHIRSCDGDESAELNDQQQLRLPISPSELNGIHYIHGYHDESYSSASIYQSQPWYQSKFSYLHPVINEVKQVLLPTLQGWSDKSLFSRFSALAAVPLVLIFTLTLPVAEMEEVKIDDVEILDEGDCHQYCDDQERNVLLVPGNQQAGSYLSVCAFDTNIETMAKIMVDELDTKQGWNKYLLVAQCVITTTFITGIFAVNEVIPFSMVYIGIGIGIILGAYVAKSTKVNEAPSWFWAVSFAGFFVALNWIFLLANEVVGLLQALGKIFELSEAIMGLTVFALGNSVGDFVANTAIAKMGFPTMAISACYAGPLLNMVLGVGVSSFYQTWKSGTYYKLEIAPTIIVSSIGLLTVLSSTLIVVNINGYRITKQLGLWMICIYITCLIINLLLEFRIIF